MWATSRRYIEAFGGTLEITALRQTTVVIVGEAFASFSRRVGRAARESGRLLQSDVMNERVGMTMHQLTPRTVLAINFGHAQ
jgi:hypothetical protein